MRRYALMSVPRHTVRYLLTSVTRREATIQSLTAPVARFSFLLAMGASGSVSFALIRMVEMTLQVRRLCQCLWTGTVARPSSAYRLPSFHNPQVPIDSKLGPFTEPVPFKEPLC